MFDPALTPILSINGVPVTAEDLAKLANGKPPGEFVLQLRFASGIAPFVGLTTTVDISRDGQGRPVFFGFRVHNERAAGGVAIVTLLADATCTRCPSTGKPFYFWNKPRPAKPAIAATCVN